MENSSSEVRIGRLGSGASGIGDGPGDGRTRWSVRATAAEAAIGYSHREL